MSTGGVFTIITNDGQQDDLIMATSILGDRLRDISRKNMEELRKKYKISDDRSIMAQDKSWVPTLNSIERTHIIFINGTYKPFVTIGHEYVKTVVSKGIANFGNQVTFTLPQFGDFINDCATHVKLRGLSAVSALDKVRWTALVGHRLFKKVDFKINGNPLDEYGSDEMNAFLQFKVLTNKKPGYLRCIGQEIPYVGYVTPDPTVDEYRQYMFFGEGAQTFKNIQPDLELTIPLLFWFKDIDVALPNFVIPFGQTDINVTLSALNELVSFADYGGGGAFNTPTIELELYSDHIFLLPEIHEIFITKFGFQLIRVHRKFTQTLRNSADSILLHEIKWPVETFYMGFRPVSNLNNSQNWFKNAVLTERQRKVAVVTPGGVVVVNNAIYYEEGDPITSLELRTYDIAIFQEFSPQFYNSYLPFQFGRLLSTPDKGWYYMNFNFYPGEYQPSGHMNFSRNREIYLNYRSDYISDSTPTELIVLADCINFLLVESGTAVLRFST